MMFTGDSTTALCAEPGQSCVAVAQPVLQQSVLLGSGGESRPRDEFSEIARLLSL